MDVLYVVVLSEGALIPVAYCSIISRSCRRTSIWLWKWKCDARRRDLDTDSGRTLVLVLERYIRELASMIIFKYAVIKFQLVYH